jgi:hypothetical protein
MPLPTPRDLHVRVIEIISSTANCTASWDQHPDPLTLSEILAIKEQLVEYIASVVDAFQRERKA